MNFNSVSGKDNFVNSYELKKEKKKERRRLFTKSFGMISWSKIFEAIQSGKSWIQASITGTNASDVLGSHKLDHKIERKLRHYFDEINENFKMRIT